MTFFKKIVFVVIVFCASIQAQSQNTPEDYIKVIESTSNDDVKFNALDSLIFKLKWNEDPKVYANYADIYIDLAIKREQYEDAIYAATYAFNSINSKLGEPERGINMLKRVENYIDKIDDKGLLGTLYLKKGGGFYNGKDYTKAVENYTKAINFYAKSERDSDSIFVADAIFFRGQAQFSLGNYVNAINDFNLGYKYYENLGEEDYMFFTQANIISTYGVNGFNDKTIAEREKLIKKKQSLNHYSGLVSDYYNQSINYGKLGDKKNQEKSLLNAKNYLDREREKPYYRNLHITLYSGLANFYTNNDQLVKAKDYLDIAEQKIDNFEELTQEELFFLKTKANYLYEGGRIIEAEKLALSTLNQTKIWGNSTLIIELNDLLYKINLKLENYKKALVYFEAKTKKQDSIFSKEKTNAFSYYQTLYETERKEKEITSQHANIKILEQEKSIEQGKTKTLISLLVLLISVAIGAIYIFKQRTQRLKEKLSFNKKELTLYINELLHKSREHDILQDELNTLKKEQVAENKLDKLQDLVSSKILTAEDWKEFKFKFEKVYPNFLVKARLNNNLTNAEERLLTLEKLNLKTSEIADVIGVSSESVIKNRYRLRKKLGLSKNIPITEIVE